jgi:hypothetical protein
MAVANAIERSPSPSVSAMTRSNSVLSPTLPEQVATRQVSIFSRVSWRRSG